MSLPIIVTRINQLAHEKGISVNTLQGLLGKHAGAFQKWYKTSPRIESLIPIADYFKISLDYLCGRTSNPHMAEEFEGLTDAQKALIGRIVQKKYTNKQIIVISDFLDEAENFSNTNKSEVE